LEAFEQFVLKDKKKKNKGSHTLLSSAKIRFKLWDSPYQNLPETLEIILKELKSIRPDFSVDNISQYFLSARERVLLNDMAVVYIQQNERDKAINLWKTLVETNDNSVELVRFKHPKGWLVDAINLARALYEAERYDESLELLEEIFATAKNPADLRYVINYMQYKSMCLIKMGRTNEGAPLFKQCIAIAYGLQGSGTEQWLGMNYAKMKEEYEKMCGVPCELG
jgi:tetratricopeptide (TPR) repeat protein